MRFIMAIALSIPLIGGIAVHNQAEACQGIWTGYAYLCV